MDVGLDLTTRVLQSVEALVNLCLVDQVLHSDLELAESVVLRLGLYANVERLETQAHGTDNGGGTAANAVEAYFAVPHAPLGSKASEISLR